MEFALKLRFLLAPVWKKFQAPVMLCDISAAQNGKLGTFSGGKQQQSLKKPNFGKQSCLLIKVIFAV